MKESIYLETTIISYYASRPNRDIVIAGHQQITKDFIDKSALQYDIFVSELVIEECKSGDKEAAILRLELLKTFNLLELNNAALSLAKSLISGKIVPNQYAEDALHIALATMHGMDYLVTWNCKHIANAHIRNKLEKAIRNHGYVLPVICTPEELMG
jgi:predicted nucleic acid-binding protein